MTGLRLLNPPLETFAEPSEGLTSTSGVGARIELDPASSSGSGSWTRVEPVATPTRELRSAPETTQPTRYPHYLSSVPGLEAGDTIKIRFPTRTDSSAMRGPLYFSLGALCNAATCCNAADWLDAASVLKRDAVRLRNSSGHGRHAYVLLTLADALTYTNPDDPTLEPGASEVLREGISILTEPFVSTDTEKGLTKALLSSGWNIAPASEGYPPA